MYRLINQKAKRFLNILNYIILNKKIMVIEEITELNNCTKRTVYNDLEELLYLFDIDFMTFNYNSVDNHLNIDDFMSMKRAILSMDLSLNLILYIFFNPLASIIDLALNFNKSETNIRNKLSNLQNEIKIFNVELKEIKGEFILYTKEPLALVLLIYDLLLITDKKEEYYLYGLNMKSFDNLQQCLKSLYDYSSEQELFNKNTPSFETKLEEIQSEIYNDFHNKHEMLDFYTDCFPEVSSDNKQRLENIFHYIFIKSKIMPVRLNDFLNRFDIFYETALLANDKFAKRFNVFIKNNSNKYENLLVHKTELFFLLYYEFIDIEDKVELNIGVYSDLGLRHINSLILQLKQIFPQHNFIKYKKSTNYDFIITTGELKEEKNNNKIRIDDYLNALDIQQIYMKIQEIAGS